jgi:phage tail-like protein
MVRSQEVFWTFRRSEMPKGAMPIGNRKDPYSGYNFIVEIDGIKAGFTEVSGLNMDTEFETIKEGGVNDYEHKLPRGIKYSDITLKRGLVDWKLWEWYKKTVYGAIERKSGTISLRDHSGNTTLMSWNFYDAFPIKWEGPMLNAATSMVASEKLVLTHQGLDASWEKYHEKSNK